MGFRELIVRLFVSISPPVTIAYAASYLTDYSLPLSLSPIRLLCSVLFSVLAYSIVDSGQWILIIDTDNE